MWNDVFLYSDDASGENFGILLMNINQFRKNEDINGDDVLPNIESLKPFSCVINLPSNLSEDNLQYFKETFDFQLSCQNLSNFTKSGAEFLEHLKSLNQNNKLFKYLNILDDTPEQELEEFQPQLSCSTNSCQNTSENQTKSGNKASRQSDDDNQDSSSSPKKSKTSDSESDGNDDNTKNVDDECSRAFRMKPQPQSCKVVFPRSVKKYQAKALAEEINSLSLNAKSKNFETLNDVEQYLTALPNKTQGN